MNSICIKIDNWTYFGIFKKDLYCENNNKQKYIDGFDVQSFSLLPKKSWILLIFSSCWSKRSIMTPIGVFFRPTPSILFSNLFFILRSLREAWIRITEGVKDNSKAPARTLWKMTVLNADHTEGLRYFGKKSYFCNKPSHLQVLFSANLQNK